MMTQVIPFSFQQQYAIRTTLIDGEPWFCLADVCAALYVDRTSDLLRNLDAKGVVKNPTLTQGGEQQMKFINEPNLYRIIFRSNRPDARTFQDWVFYEVLPALRRQGRYEMPAVRTAESSLTLTQTELADLIERCITRGIRAAIGAPRARRVRFSEAEKAQMLEWRGQGVPVAEIARRLNRSAGSVGNFLLQHRRQGHAAALAG